MNKPKEELENFFNTIKENCSRNGYKTYYPEQPFKYGYNIHTNENLIGKIPLGNPLPDGAKALLERFINRPWFEKKRRLNFNSLAEIFTVATIAKEAEKRYIGLLKSKLRRCCNVQNPDPLTWEEIFTAIEDYLSDKQKKRRSQNHKHQRVKKRPPKNESIKLFGFMRLCCKADSLNKDRLGSLKKNLMDAHYRGKIKLPKPIKPAKQKGQSHFYNMIDLIEKWPEYRLILPYLPELKP